MTNEIVGPKSEQGADGRPPPRRDAPTHPVWKANLFMAGVVILLLVVSASSVADE